MRKFYLYVIFVFAFALITAPALAGETVNYPDEFPPKVLQAGGGLTDVLAPSNSDTGKSPSLSGNIVNLNSGAVDHVIGAVNAIAGDMDVVSGNQVFIKGGTVDKAVWGAFAEDATVSGNSVTISGGSGMNENVMGGYSNNGNVANNTVTITGGSLNMPAYGGLGDGDATGNTVTISGGSLKIGVAGGSSVGGGDAINNTVIINGNPSFALGYEIYGGVVSGGGDDFSGNTLKLGISTTVKNVANFENYEFIIPSSVGNGGTLLTVTDPVDLAGTTLDITGISSASSLRPGHTITLISNVTNDPVSINGTPYIADLSVTTSVGMWKFSASAGALTATAVSLPSGGGGGGGGGGCDAFGGFGILALAMLLITRKGR